MKYAYLLIALAFSSLIVPSVASAAPIQGPGFITASTDIQPCHVSICLGLGTNIAEIADGDFSNSNGFAGQDGVTGIIKLSLSGLFNLTSFSLYNDIVVRKEGVETFKLHFFDATESLISSSAILNAPVSQNGPETYSFLSPILGVKSVDFEVLTLLTAGAGSRIEVREVLFDGIAVTSVPLPPTVLLMTFGLFVLRLTSGRRRLRAV